ncbi:class I SAM-dependent methyltransferase [Candidatus Bathyarchaeota archaeon]|jgi:ubiquinone/menaquinone biosynthesis C-methylase UbiE|nr:class I SAM-dependent methyltransferase [Candidatus Bathyarchaeota archaeon]
MNVVDLLTGGAEDLGEADEISVIDRLVGLAGLNIMDVGCGDGRVTRQLVEHGALALGVEPDPIQAEKNRAADSMPGLTFMEAPGQSLPAKDGSIDGVFFSYSLHHIPRKYRDGALIEAARVLKPETGFLYVMEPMLVGSMDALYRPFNDETEVRTQAYEALKRTAAPLFTEARELHYYASVHYDSFTVFVEEVAGTTYNHFSRERVDTPEVNALFEAGRAGDDYVFIEHTRVNLYRGPRP